MSVYKVKLLKKVVADLGNGRSRELIIPFGGSGYILVFEIIGDDIVVGAVRHQREEDYRH